MTLTRCSEESAADTARGEPEGRGASVSEESQHLGDEWVNLKPCKTSVPGIHGHHPLGATKRRHVGLSRDSALVASVVRRQGDAASRPAQRPGDTENTSREHDERTRRRAAVRIQL